MKRQSVFSSLFLMLLCPSMLIAVRAQQRERTVRQPSAQASSTGAAQDPSEVVRINTRVVFVNTLVKNKRTGQPVKDLTAGDFQLFDDGKLRKLSYFSREGDGKRPLALILVTDIAWPSLIGWYGGGTKLMERFAAVLGQLPPEDEVAVVVTRYGEESAPCLPMILGGDKTQPMEIRPMEVLQGLTRDRTAVSAALRSIPDRAKQIYPLNHDATRSGAEDYKMLGIACVPDEVLRITQARPSAQVVTLFITDDIEIFSLAKRNEMAEKLVQTGTPVYALVTGRNFFYDFGVGYFGNATTDNKRANAVQYLARETGGEAVRVRAPDKYAEAFERIIGSIAARYSLGFTLSESEHDDGQMHKLEVKVKARDARGKERKLIVSARRGYYMPKPSAPEPAVK